MMRIQKEKSKWQIQLDSIDSAKNLIDTVRNIISLIDDVKKARIKEHLVELDLEFLETANSSLIAQFVVMQAELVKVDGRLRIINANPVLQSTFDVVMLDKVISIWYKGEKPMLEEEDDEIKKNESVK